MRGVLFVAGGGATVGAGAADVPEGGDAVAAGRSSDARPEQAKRPGKTPRKTKKIARTRTEPLYAWA